MGFAFSLLPFFDACHSIARMDSPFLSLGDQALQESPDAVEKFSLKNKYEKLAVQKTFRELLCERYGIAEYADLDLNNKAMIQTDLSKPVSGQLKGKWKTIYDGGTIEHIFDIAAAFKNIHDLCHSEGGVMLHVSPVTWFSHGYYNLTQRLFEAVARVNQYRTIAVGYCFRNAAQLKSNGFFSMLERRPSIKGMVLTEIDGKRSQFFEFIESLKQSEFFPSESLFCVALQKQANTAFVNPYDVQ